MNIRYPDTGFSVQSLYGDSYSVLPESGSLLKTINWSCKKNCFIVETFFGDAMSSPSNRGKASPRNRTQISQRNGSSPKKLPESNKSNKKGLNFNSQLIKIIDFYFIIFLCASLLELD